MKKFFCYLFCLLLASQIEALPLCVGEHSAFRVRIRNYSSYDCTLAQGYLIRGSLTNDTEIPRVVFKGFYESFDMGMVNSYAANVLTYQCGEDHKVTLHSLKFRRRHEFKMTDATVVEIQNLAAIPSFKKEDCNDWKSGYNYNTVDWIIRDPI